MRSLADAGTRERALDVRRSFIVQAPAGSGKTELLIQRVLALLAVVDAPEEIVAITFTRKAAGEMRDRVLRALAAAAQSSMAQAQDCGATEALANAAWRRDTEAGWGLVEHPGRLRVLTIDALCANLARQMPLLSNFGGLPATVEDASALYQEAARRALASLEGDDEAASAVASVLQHLDNDGQLAERLVAGMLAQRDQWLRHVADRHSSRLDRSTLEAGLQRLVRDAIAHLRTLVPAHLVDTLIEVARYAGANVRKNAPNDPLARLAELEVLPSADPRELETWCALASLVLTQEGKPRRRLDVGCGFPAAGNEKDKRIAAGLEQWKVRATDLIDALCADEDVRVALHAARALPQPRYSEAQWDVLRSLIAVLPLAVAHLHVLFKERRQIDFTAVAQAAAQALGEEDAPTDLALALDYRIRHLLVDEFQDTSHAQFELLTKLTAGWQPDDGRTLFLVGDPMQSIYRFREAEVALYLRARQHGIGSVRLEPLTLTVNFRSQAKLLDWVNGTFRALLPGREDLASGAVTFSASLPWHEPLAGQAVHVHPMFSNDRAIEAQHIVELVHRARRDDPEQSIAVLVRSRAHIGALMAAMKTAGLRPQAIEIDLLADRPFISDLHALTRALLHPADRIAWLAVLRAPWCGLTLTDLDALARHDASACIVDLISRDAVVCQLSQAGQQRLRAFDAIVRAALGQRRRANLARWVEGLWLALGGPATAQDAADLADARAFFDLIAQMEQGADLIDFQELSLGVEKLYAAPQADSDPRLQLMTIHKAKGLEFDTVILAGLGYAPRNRDARLLLWLEREWEEGSDLLLAPMKARANGDDPLYDQLSKLDAAKSNNEDTRLLYVAATRAKRHLHMIGHAECKNDRLTPAANSLLACMWPVLEAAFRAAYSERVSESSDTPALPSATPMILRRLASDWRRPQPPPRVGAALPTPLLPEIAETVEFSWASETARHTGSVVHSFLQRFAEEGIDAWTAARVKAMEQVFARDLRARGVPEAELPPALERVTAALCNALRDERARWVLSVHSEAACEIGLTAQLDGVLIDLVIDRTFVDPSGTRWIVDYKTGIHEGGDLQAFLDREQQRYRDQLERYARVMQMTDARPIKLALYFPLLGAWREWNFAPI
ncbi:MAG TPA: UvrD-helicase domain-containing protein [Burkholderiales bacterium]|nr:UvrD-helicase domain-containing protein [Burkholderiales bacterium]